MEFCIVKKGERRNNGRNRTTKSEKHQNSWREDKLPISGNIGNGHQIPEMKEVRKEFLRRTRKLLKTKFY